MIVIYPHTSNWDFIVGLLYKVSAGLPIRWMGKHTLFRWPVRRLFMRLGGIPIRRDQRSNSVELLLAEFASRDCMWLAVAPEGTRSRTDHWKSGFYRIAVAGKLPLGLGYIDYATHTVGIDTYLTLTGDAGLDFARIREFYKDKRGRRPENAGDVRLRD
jgi:1-acyl-sn-glycerol-3-phosphate acyltransferase